MKKVSFIFIFLCLIINIVNSFEWNGKIKECDWDEILNCPYTWISKEVFDTFYEKDRDVYLKSFPKLKEKEGVDLAFDKYVKWYELRWIEELCIAYRNNQKRLCFFPQYFIIQDIKQLAPNQIQVSCILPDYSRNIISDSILDFSFITKENKYIFFLIFDGDYIKVYVNDLNTLFNTYAKISKEDEDLFFKCLKTNNWENIKIQWPRHADGSCDYENKKTSVAPSGSVTNVSINKVMTASENLKLRSGEATSSNVITVMSAGTKVKILQLGKAETIDGINSNWVKVEVQANAKDRDGKPIKKGTIGWCYGGYLK